MALIPILTFTVAERTYALPVADVLEVAAMVELLPMAQSLPEIMGLVNRHGSIIPLLDMRVILGQPSSIIHIRTFFIVVQMDGIITGLVVDHIEQVKYIPEDAFQAVPGNVLVQTIVNDAGVIVQMVSLTPLLTRLLAQMG